ncbi:metalloendopeptidase WSS1 NDAI_0B04520 [Naumovozyma dairenensis CBS 421]|uniref:WLM domain-containing protein n=1 Tax=Naumovozyma dairenensis (strain ATCC 10597 / BCRC 20456 / CBS 421 / NBRC 0211 / NRRL Y-12639) TaxID=1071378 RepID=G0W6S6_NAUDC|nr:hypothetical protein NDAI_0B04520 [Naumovozyma dairenensis CBS 421]CCD23487.1 hypothetical protein NDAI_0B04520 [Naumovozyma dairenensis CBS 421]
MPTQSHENPHITKIAVLQRKPNAEYALSILKDITKQVSYLMKENKFKVSQLVEFYPKDKRLLGMNVNRGQKIMLRLRDSNDEFQFLARESILGTMLHELTHNLFGPHDKKFYEKLDDLSARQWIIEQQGLFDTFLGSGNRLGGSTLGNNRNNNLTAGRIRGNVVGRPIRNRFGKGRKLGSLEGPNKLQKYKTPREMAAIAAERRYNDDKWCGEKNSDETKRALQPSSDSLYEQDIIIIDDDDDDDDEGNLISRGIASTKHKHRDKKSIEGNSNKEKDIEIIDLT